MNEQSGWSQKKLSEIGEFIRGRRFVKSDYVESGLGCIHYAQVHTDFKTTTRLPLTFLPEDFRTRMRLAHPGDLVIAATSENVDDVGKAVAWMGNDDVAIHDDCYIFRHELDPPYVSYFFASSLFQNQKIKYVSETKVVRISGANLGMIEIPVPPPEIQVRIVKILGAVDNQITSLEAEARALAEVLRRRRADLISNDSVGAVRAEDAFDFSTGVRRTPDRASGPYMTPYLRSANVGYGRLDLSDVLEMNYDPVEREKFGLRYGDVLVSEGSASTNAVGMPAMWRDELPAPVCTQMTLLRLRAREGVCIPEFAFHWSMWAYESRAFLDVAGGTNIKHISAKRAKGMTVRLPSLDRQREMVAELDALGSASEAIRAEADRLREVRARLLSALLERTIDIESAELEI
ncbi:restriction endonuclease subunit S [Glycomyces sp. A-F 0318]|uniref:restriction endonuclease subunit S n=1 Tax=Glycomyces amatae TaxID=2881355 RepID=UPI001E2836F4|nr:restriction endonuclease subunit S [Glycomyces amatae]MCD0444303.1 restriction endonuclease subunit S [Glycomyces amatae]